MQITVVGAGVIGLTSAIVLRERGHEVMVRAAEIPGRTSLTAAAMWGSYLAGPAEKVATWSNETLAVLTEQAGQHGTGVRMGAGVEDGVRKTIPVLDMPSYLDYLLRRFRDAGGNVERSEVADLEATGTTVVNCTGVGARALTADPELVPVRGQLVVLRNPGIQEWYLAKSNGAVEFTHFLPHGDIVIAGGVAHEGREDLDPDLEIAEGIVRRCAEVDPRLAKAEVLAHRVGLRPARPTVRLEAVAGSRGTHLIHNYGHGGAGISLSWGCAAEVADLIG